jgi:hypothetical protein
MLLSDCMNGILLLMDVSGFSTESLSLAATAASRVRRPPSPLPARRTSPPAFRAVQCKTFETVMSTAAFRPARTKCLSVTLSSFTTEWVASPRGYRPTHHVEHLSFYLIWNCPSSYRSCRSVSPQDINLSRKVTETFNLTSSILSTFQENVMSIRIRPFLNENMVLCENNALCSSI